MIGVGLSATLSGGRKARVNLDPMPALDLNFATNRSLPADYGPTPSFSRASTGTYFNSSGVLTLAAINAPRFDHTYNGTSWISRGLLVEEQRTNSLTYSENFSNAYWTKFNSPTLTADTSETTSPDGNNAATKVVSGTTSETDIYRTGIYSGSAAITFSIYAKAGTSNFFGIGLNGGAADFTVNFDLSNGTYNQRNSTGYTGTSISITSVGNGWYRCSLTVTNPSVSTGVYLYCCANSASTSATTSGNSMYLFGAQFEVGAFQTSYIKSNSGSSTTRSADVCQITGSDFSSFWNASEGSVAVEYIQHKPLNIGTVVSFSDGGTSNVLYDYASEGTSGGTDYGPSFYIRSGGTFTVENNNSPIGSGLQKYAVTFKANDFAMSYLGRTVQTDTTVTLPTVNQMGIGKALFAQYPFSGHISRLRYFNTRLTNSKLQELST